MKISRERGSAYIRYSCLTFDVPKPNRNLVFKDRNSLNDLWLQRCGVLHHHSFEAVAISAYHVMIFEVILPSSVYLRERTKRPVRTLPLKVKTLQRMTLNSFLFRRLKIFFLLYRNYLLRVFSTVFWAKNLGERYVFDTWVQKLTKPLFLDMWARPAPF